MPEAVDLDAHTLSGAHPRRGRGGARREHVARRERHEFGHIGEQPRHRAYQIRGARGLYEHAVDIGADRQGVRVATAARGVTRGPSGQNPSRAL